MTADRLARFTPAPGPDPAELLFRMGRASAPTRLRWKLAVAALVASNAAMAWLALRPAPAPAPVVVPVVVPVPVPESPGAPLEAWSYGALRANPDAPAETFARVVPPGPPLTPLAARRGAID